MFFFSFQVVLDFLDFKIENRNLPFLTSSAYTVYMVQKSRFLGGFPADNHRFCSIWAVIITLNILTIFDDN